MVQYYTIRYFVLTKSTCQAAITQKKSQMKVYSLIYNSIQSTFVLYLQPSMYSVMGGGILLYTELKQSFTFQVQTEAHGNKNVLTRLEAW